MSSKSYASTLARPASLFIGIDLGTSGCRAEAINVSKEIVAESHVDYPKSSVQTPELWWQATQAVIKDITTQVKQYHIEAIAIDGTSATVLLCSEEGIPLTPALMYHDQRATKQAELLKRVAPHHSVATSASSGLAKALWLIEHYPQNKPFRFVHQADWVAGQLCRRFDFSDINNALKTGYDANNRHWPLWISDLGFDTACLPRVCYPGDKVTTINLNIAKQLGLPIDVDIIAGTTDSTAAFIAASEHESPQPGDAVTSLGSSLVVKVVSDVELNDPASGIYSQPYDQYWLVGGASNSGGAVLKFYFTSQQMKTMSQHVRADKPTGLDYYPLLNKGERFPFNDPEFQPRLTPKTANDVLFFQGMLEGIANIEHEGYKLLYELGAPYPTSVKTVGGGAKNTAWQQIREKKLGVPVICAKHSEAAYGSALLASKHYFLTQAKDEKKL